ncbi:myosin light chain kinase 3 [Alligator mississippiensis]|uniref:Myosin light chain kinase 3 n=1 Tax=Alligator mississippiensis TaxID=8496 RepID=A0A151MS38_ALLMI|nr:myosin light chain kinase 3 [Alligator mississippiensis]KYO27260.1 myosin light chain kinase 3 [Alligator mississippiensis]
MLVSNSNLLHGWKQNERTKEKNEEKDEKPEHAPKNRGAEADSKESLEDTKREKTLDENNRACEKVNSSTVVSKIDSSPQSKQRISHPLMVEPAAPTSSSKSCPPKKEAGIAAFVQNNGLGFINQDPSESQNVPIKAHCMDKAPRQEDYHKMLAHQKSKEKESKPSTMCSTSLEAMPSTSKSVSGIEYEVIRTRVSINVQMTEAQQKTVTTKDGSQGDHKHRNPKIKPLSSSSEVERVTLMSDKFKHKQCPKNTRPDPVQEVKGVKPDNKQSEQALQLGKPQMLLNKPTAGKKTDGKLELKCKSVTSRSTTPKDTKKDPGATLKSHNETTQGSTKDAKPERAELDLENASLRGSESDANQCTGKTTENTKSTETSKALARQDEVIIDDSPPPPAPFEHRIVNVKQAEVTASYSVCQHEVLGGGRFGQVHKCTEISTDLNLAAKIIKVKGEKEKEEVKNEINIMNQLNHVNLIQLYDAFESKNNFTLIVEYLDGGELFDRITDENYNLTELDAILFTKQICEGVHYLHQQYILHLDLKPENILCVNRTGNQIKIIDFGLARRYKPREKLKVNFGTPEFLAPEVVNYDFVSFPTDMWSVGVITYILLSGLSPFLGETDAETMNYIVNCSWDFDAEAFEQVSEEAKDFIAKLLVKEKSCRISATQCLKHEWLNDLPGKAKKSKLRLKSQLLLQSYLAQRKWKKHFYVVAAANRLKRFQSMSVNLV